MSVFVTAPDGLLLHVRVYGSRRPSALPIVCLPGFARTAADFHSLATALVADPAEPRYVIAPDYRGHGQSEYDRNANNYRLGVDLADVSVVLTGLAIAPGIFVGSSYGGILAMMLALSRPTAIAAVILNDIGPVIEPQGLLQIKRYVGRLPVPRDFMEGAEILRWLFAAQFTKLAPQDWLALAERTWRKHAGALVPDYDVRLARTLQRTNLENPAATLWNEFDALARVPLMIIRGANSAMLSSNTLNAMLARRGADIVVVPDQGHAPLLTEPKLIRRIAAFIASCHVSDRTTRPLSSPTDLPGVAPKYRSDRLLERLQA